ncbi:protocatechuate 3,4-dioxygenase subunit alpha [Leeuwenhoekiella sp. NPDC079379]|uniref:protocatechuate 3,4-dioxygenase subunit alpha n=1 Tax=Leeuwenhoekiella sp. NPDC079379 TaxID=3364122 RepID=UPI0037C520F8
MNSLELYNQTPSQTIGPYFAYGLTPQQYGYDFKSWVDNDMTKGLKSTRFITITGTIYDGNAKPIDDAMLELWQDDGEHQLFGRYGTGTETENSFTFKTIKPKSVNGQAPFINVILFMRGQLLHSYTRIYFEDESQLNSTDVVFSGVPLERQTSLIAKKKGDQYLFNIYMQGAQETVFFDI